MTQCLAIIVLSVSSFAAVAQQPPSGVPAQKAAMQKLSFLAGTWSGPITVVRGPGEPLHLTQTEIVQYKLDGLVMQIEGSSRNLEGKVVFSALATISFDDVAHVYHFRAYNDGHYVDTELTVPGQGFSWNYAAGPAHIENTMHLSEAGEWVETTTAAVGSNPPRPSVEMRLKHQ